MTSTDLITFEEKTVTQFGNKFLGALLMHEQRKTEAEQELARAETRETILDTELVKALLFLHQTERLNLIAVRGKRPDVQALYRAIRIDLGIMQQVEGMNGAVNFEYTSEEMRDAYDFSAAIANYVHDTKRDGPTAKYSPEEVAAHVARRSRTNGLNARLQRACFAALALAEAGTHPEHLTLREREDGVMEPVLINGPKAIMGDAAEVVIKTGRAEKAKGAAVSPTITGLSQIAKKPEAPAPAQPTGSAATNEEASAGTGPLTEKDFIGMVNTLIMQIKTREGTFSDIERTALKSLAAEITANKIK
jgi:hypothetical protein